MTECSRSEAEIKGDKSTFDEDDRMKPMAQDPVGLGRGNRNIPVPGGQFCFGRGWR